jgi:hypothetical protein
MDHGSIRYGFRRSLVEMYSEVPTHLPYLYLYLSETWKGHGRDMETRESVTVALWFLRLARLGCCQLLASSLFSGRIRGPELALPQFPSRLSPFSDLILLPVFLFSLPR